jgi:dipeptidyl-peptidase-4
VADYQLIKPQFVNFKAADGQTTLYAELLMPPSVPSGTKVPLIMNPYGGPGGQVVRDVWGGANGLFDQIMARRGFAILKIDNRGMAHRGKAFIVATRRKLGEIELADQLAALDQALQRYPQLDSNRLGWWGWSYGGYMTLYAMTHSDRFKAGVSVAPVTDWHLYDSTYTERYMGLPKENADEYKKTAPLNAAKNLSGKLLIVHGTSDDNVHMQNTVAMINALINAGKPFDLQLYPRKTHGIAGTQARTHLFHRIERQFEENLLQRPPEQAAGEQ